MTGIRTITLIGSALMLVALDASVPAQAATRKDHYQCYDITALSTFTPRDAMLTDQFGQKAVQVTKPVMLCAPVQKNAETIIDPVTHYLCYETQPPTPVGKTAQIINQFGKLKVRIDVSRLLCVPSVKKLIITPG